MLELRPGRQDDIRSLAELWTHSFPGSRPLAERMEVLETGGRHGGIETVRLAEENGRLMGALKTIPFTQFMSGGAVPMMGLAAVGVAPWARRRGVGSALCGEALRSAHEGGDAVSVLYPFRPSFYERLGWGLVGELHSYRFRPESLPDMADPEVRLAEVTDADGITACYERVARGSNGLIQRDEALWQKQRNADGIHTFVYGRPGISGYMVLRYGTSARSPDFRVLWIRELVAEDRVAYERLLGWISRQRDLWRRVRYDALADEGFGVRLSDPRPPGYRQARWLWAETARILRGPMIRIVNTERAFTLRSRWGPAPAQSFRLIVADSELPENCGPWHVHYDGTELRIGPPDRGSTQPLSSLEIDGSALAQVYVGELSVTSTVGLGRARVNGDLAPLDALFRTDSRFRLLDEF